MSDEYQSEIRRLAIEAEGRLWEQATEVGIENTKQSREMLQDVAYGWIGHRFKTSTVIEASPEQLAAYEGASESVRKLSVAIFFLSNLNTEKICPEDIKLLCTVNRTLGQIEGEGDGALNALIMTRQLLKRKSQEAAFARHKENRDLKAQGLQYYAENRAKFSNKDEAALAITKVVPVSFATARKWLKGQ